MAKWFVTGDAVFDTAFTVVIRIPKSQKNWLYFVFQGAIDYLSQQDSWVTGGETTPAEAAEIFDDIQNNGIWVDVINVGDIKWTTAPPSTNWLLCDGNYYSPTDYPDLYNAIGTIFNTGGEPPGYFRVPDIRGRTIVMTNNGSGRAPSWANTLGGAGGVSDQDLTVNQLASHTHTTTPHTHALTPHTHTEGSAAATVINGGLEAPAASATPVPSITGAASDGISTDDVTVNATGNGDTHNNMQPSIALSAWILAVV
ncbi:MAG TPA: phage tail protein [Ktedonobacteraceae bacterium]|nr:phage tail protein [Ktedonobacteraceae bacterium]